MSVSRRDVLLMGAGVLAASATSSLLRAAQAKKIPVGLQLYSVRDDCAKNLPAVLEAVAKMSYKGVEFAGYHGRSAADLKKLLDANGLMCCGTHTGYNTVVGDELKKTAEFNLTIGNTFLIVPGLGGKQVGSKAALLETAKALTEVTAKAKELGCRVGYHAHGGDAKKYDGETQWDILFANTPKDFIHQIDFGNYLSGGGDPYAAVKQYPGRSLTVHLKEQGGPKGAVIGQGEVRWNEVFELCEGVGATQWYVVEQESYVGTPLDAVKGCMEALKKMGKA